jgi:hypothetical protein
MPLHYDIELRAINNISLSPLYRAQLVYEVGRIDVCNKTLQYECQLKNHSYAAMLCSKLVSHPSEDFKIQFCPGLQPRHLKHSVPVECFVVQLNTGRGNQLLKRLNEANLPEKIHNAEHNCTPVPVIQVYIIHNMHLFLRD